MKLLSQSHFFELHGDKFVYRPTPFSMGFSVSAEEKDRLHGQLERLGRRVLTEAIVAMAAVVVAFFIETSIGSSPTPWFLVAAILAVALLSLTAFHRQRRIVGATFGDRRPDVGRLPLRQALTRPRPVFAKRYTLRILHGVIGMLLLVIVAVDALALFPIMAAFRSRRYADGLADHEAIAEMLSLTLYNPQYWAIVAGMNVILLLFVGLMVMENRRLRALPDLDAPASRRTSD
ncbi:MAG: hypothetical protein GKS02_06440 [Alphaproteobacteria bacterium]|nr:hypothetical protein [Alphaproteobacteria bacterium]